MTNSQGPRTWSLGTLVYTRAGLISLFGWLLWGDFMYTLMECVMPLLLPLLLKDHGASNSAIAVITGTIYMAANAILNPIISYQSDRFRSRWGRRRPFILFSTPFVVLFLTLIPFGVELERAVSSLNGLGTLLRGLPCAPLLLVFGVLVLGFQVFNMFVSSVYYYLIPDVVPQELLGRFYALFRLCGVLGGMFFNAFIFGHAGSYMKAIFVVTAGVYGVCITMMCLKVREGEYPPPKVEPRGDWFAGIRTYARECFGRPYWWLVFFTYSCAVWANVAGVFGVFFYRDEIKMSLDLIGKMGATIGVLHLLLTYPIGILLDRWGSHRTLVLGYGLGVVLMLLGFFLSVNVWTAFFWKVISTIWYAVVSLAMLKWTVDLYPRERYGQFGSAGALFSSLGGMILGPVSGWLMDMVGVYRFFFLWFAFWSFLGLVGAWAVHLWQIRETEARSRA